MYTGEINERFRKARVKKGLSIRELSKITGIGTTTIINIEHMKYKRSRVQTLKTLANALDQPVDFLFAFAQESITVK